MEIKPIKTEADYQSALKEIEGLFDVQTDTPAADRLEVLMTLVEAFEEKHYPIPLPDPVEAILYFMESRGLSRRELEPYIGSRARVSEILNRKRQLTMEMIRKLHKGLGISAEVLIQPYPSGSGPLHGFHSADRLRTGKNRNGNCPTSPADRVAC
jgi:HTH-type transcriptional regulator / antitoxin HigA